MSLSDIRRDYQRQSLDEKDLDPDPIRQFELWFADALAADVVEANAATLATAAADGRPSARIVLLKGCDPRGFTFYTNYGSRKGRELAANPRAAMLFFWKDLERQVSIEGPVERVSAEESEEYFHSRPVASQVGAWASKQSQVIPGREHLENLFRDYEAKFAADVVPRPETWGGFRILPETLEFWQGRPSRLHDRLRYHKDAAGAWTVERLSP
ncbi:pyridoxamine 5'-phosphate oxidase [Paludisphaera mucosa]|uniref:Pyridoxine/pyridoxamine 5'-phosphate oxidase n=1 Tax=Paludisphaera mucosa TaxID=3030827 RepID=A0ABT6FDJ5_9BACT|nr:pyridoxamine 5'-phosphate oxidase [Paludisphaera mucosa]MDG3005662.1 pyridoxamine 5'-phosphate oxidase [Paludisphaera mucosa]